MKRLVMVLILFVLWCMTGIPAFGDLKDEVWEEISAPEVKSMMESTNVLVVHVLSEIEYHMQHITGSINIPIIQVESSDRLPSDRHTPIIFYCMGTR